jgi:hypothetical protein
MCRSGRNVRMWIYILTVLEYVCFKLHSSNSFSSTQVFCKVHVHGNRFESCTITNTNTTTHTPTQMHSQTHKHTHTHIHMFSLHKHKRSPANIHTHSTFTNIGRLTHTHIQTHTRVRAIPKGRIEIFHKNRFLSFTLCGSRTNLYK